MSDLTSRIVLVVDDSDIADALRNDELAEEELMAYRDDGSPVSYRLVVDNTIDANLICAASGIDPGEENELADSDRSAMLWDSEAVEEALAHLKSRMKDSEGLASDLLDEANQLLDNEVACDLQELVDVLENVDKGYEPDPAGHPALGACALLIRLLLAFRVAAREECAVVVI
jgi:hypothetical protein